jgi:cytosine/adenosine deaminase-related metal-dependent hydrolase
MSRTFTARWVFPVSGPPLERGTVTVEGDRIEAVEPHGVRSPDEDLGNAAVIPGLVNAHTHLDLSGARGLIPPTDPDHFTDWLRGVIAYRRSRAPEQVQADIRAGLAECLRHGTTLLGDIASEGASWDALAEAPTRAVVFRELIGAGFSWQDTYFNAHAWLSERNSRPDCRPGLSPHAPYTVRSVLFVAVAGRCEQQGIPSATHVAESPGETELVLRRSGPFVPFLADFGTTDTAPLITDFADLVGAPSATAPRLFVHCNYLPPDFAFGSNHFVVYCPRTHAAFGHPSHPFRDFLARGVRVCLGTDGLASNPDLDILAEARFVRSRYPDFPGEQLLRMVTLSGAEALGWSDECGSLDAGKSADFVAVPLPDAEAGDPHELLLAERAGAWSGREAALRRDRSRVERRTMFRGQWRN